MNTNKRTKNLSGGLQTESSVDQAISAIFDDLAAGSYNQEQTKLMLSALGKKLNLESLKIRAGYYKTLTGKSQGFFSVPTKHQRMSLQ